MSVYAGRGLRRGVLVGVSLASGVLSAANLIVAEQSELGFRAYFRFGAITTLVTTAFDVFLLG